MSKVQGGAAKSGSVFEPFELTHAAKKLAGKVMHLVCLFISYLLTPLLLDIIVLCMSGIKDFVYQRAEGELINRIFNATSA